MASSSNPMGSKKRKTSVKHASNATKKGAASNNPIPSDHVSRFPSDSDYQKFIRACSNREVVIERIFNEEFLRKIEFPWLDRLKEWGWWSFMCQEVDVNPNLVKLFYFNGDNKMYDDDGIESIGIEKNDEFTTKVLGEDIVVNDSVIHKYMEGNVIEGDDVSIPDNYPIVEKCKIIYKDPSICCLETSTSKMDLCTRILHLMVCQVLFPRRGAFANASRRDIYWMGKIMDNEPPNLCALIVKRMLEVVKLAKTHKNSHGLCYGKLVSKICRGECDVSATEPVDNRGEMAPLNETAVHSMGWHFNEETRTWVKKGERNQAPEVSEITMDSMMVEIRGMFNAMGERMDGMDNRLERIEGNQQLILNQQQVITGRQQALEQQVQHVNANFQAFRNNEQYDPPFPYYQPPQP